MRHKFLLLCDLESVNLFSTLHFHTNRLQQKRSLYHFFTSPHLVRARPVISLPASKNISTSYQQNGRSEEKGTAEYIKHYK
ncbi:hypothetical protein [Alloprevotella tannerae]|uniref:hypothetical protein n=1 Tax=Alloprevotella tannerae TaxID=76122 RepID=UPI0028F09849|nr:hypothetical protein [Alloprevotella tannerae]